MISAVSHCAGVVTFNGFDGHSPLPADRHFRPIRCFRDAARFASTGNVPSRGILPRYRFNAGATFNKRPIDARMPYIHKASPLADQGVPNRIRCDQGSWCYQLEQVGGIIATISRATRGARAADENGRYNDQYQKSCHGDILS